MMQEGPINFAQVYGTVRASFENLASGSADDNTFCMRDLDPYLLAVAVIGAIFVGVWLQRRWTSWTRRRRMKRLRKMGMRGESRAAGLLARHGFVLEQTQVSGHIEVRVDGVPSRYRVRADGVASRGGRRYVVEIKGGMDAARIANRTTRRQLLEYAIATQTDAVVLVDAARHKVHVVEFPMLAG